MFIQFSWGLTQLLLTSQRPPQTSDYYMNQTTTSEYSTSDYHPDRPSLIGTLIDILIIIRSLRHGLILIWEIIMVYRYHTF